MYIDIWLYYQARSPSNIWHDQQSTMIGSENTEKITCIGGAHLSLSVSVSKAASLFAGLKHLVGLVMHSP